MSLEGGFRNVWDTVELRWRAQMMRQMRKRCILKWSGFFCRMFFVLSVSSVVGGWLRLMQGMQLSEDVDYGSRIAM